MTSTSGSFLGAWPFLVRSSGVPWALSTGWYWGSGCLPQRGEVLFRELGGVVCALTSAVLASAAFWALFRGSLSPTNRSRDLVMLVFVPTIVATIAMWVAG